MINSLPEDIRKAILDRGNFELTSICPKGGNGYVVLGRDNILERDVAIKFIYDIDSAITEEPKKLFNIDHPNVLKVYDARLYAKESLYFITPVAKGGDLDDYIEKNDISLKEALNIVHGILDGITQLHTPPDIYLHRDIKPSNIFMEKRKPIIGDFGSIKKIDNVDKCAKASKMSLFFKTPECIKWNRHYIESDIYQIGVIFYMLLGGKISYSVKDYMSDKEKESYKILTDNFQKIKFEDNVVFKCILNGKIFNIKSLPIYIPKNIIRVVVKATNLDYKKRYHSTADFMKDISQIMADIPDWIEIDSIIYIRNFKKRNYKIESAGSFYFVFKQHVGSSKWIKEKDSKTIDRSKAIRYLMNTISK